MAEPRPARYRWILLGLCLCACVNAGETATAPDTIEARAQGCSTCHGPLGEGTADLNFPRIAGKPAGYLFNQLKNFRDGNRSYPPMNYLLAYMHDDYLQELAAFFAAQPAQFSAGAEVAAALNDAGAQLVERGDATHGVPACVLCHGKKLTGIEPGIPGLTGLNARYIAAQLVAWRVGTRHARAPDCMQQVASRLTEAQIRQVSVWLAAQAPAAAFVPAPVGTWATPITCGSQP
jgi:cytochrome c553